MPPTAPGKRRRNVTDPDSKQKFGPVWQPSSGNTVPKLHRQRIDQHRQEIAAILEGRDRQRLLLVVGPCVAWPFAAVVNYCKRLKKLEAVVRPRIKIVVRVFTQKSRTVLGWGGPFFQPDPWGAPDIAGGIAYTRSLYAAVTQLGLAIGSEIVSTHSIPLISDYLSWVAIGARSSESPEHRVLASDINLPVGIKNPTSGSIEHGVNGVVVVRHPHSWLFFGQHHMTRGNSLAHLVLRGGKLTGPNYSSHHVRAAVRFARSHGVARCPILIDASHDNCTVNHRRDYRMQIHVIEKTLQSMAANHTVAETVRGFLLESFLRGGAIELPVGAQSRRANSGISVMDPCLGWADTAATIRRIYDVRSGNGSI
ncbi:MAG: 3-deoxy-7-phosphoheptulonate synthase [Patescibacteria group bacterium]